MSVVIQVENLSKYYRLGTIGRGTLRDVSFQVREGEILGIIRRNGAGKSTLLKILSRITAPTSGQIKNKCRVGSLLEVGTGFHPGFTGRENTDLKSAILDEKLAYLTFTPERFRCVNDADFPGRHPRRGQAAS